MTDEKPEQKASRIVHIDIERDQQISVPAERLHEQTVAIYDLLDDNSFALKEDSDQGLIRGYRLHLKTDFRHVYFDVRDEDDTVLNGFGMALGPFRRIVREYHIVAPAITMLSGQSPHLRFRRSIWGGAGCMMKVPNC